ncbi:MAG: pectate lyase [Paludibacter sp.]
MQKINFYFLIFSFFISQFSFAQTPAFPGAAGGGKFVTGGRGGKVLYVTSLADDGSVGTLRWAITQSGTRTILFKVSGLITLKSALKITIGNVTIAGQTAPGDGICLKNYEMNVDADNVIIRYMRFRLGNEITTNESDAIWGRNRKNIIIDHCSMSWSIDECASFYSNENFTLQWCVIAESLNNAGHVKGAHGYGGIWGGKNASYHHNLIAHHNSRNPRFNGWKRSGLSYENPLDEERLDFRNNVVYNFGDNGSYGGEAAGKYNIVGNYIKYGPATKSTIKYKVTQVDIDASTAYGQQFGTYFIQDNYVYGSATNTLNNWLGVTYASGVNTTNCKASVPFLNEPIPLHTAETAFVRVLDYAGASLVRDAVDVRVVNETRNGTATYTGSVTLRPGIIDKPTDVGGWPIYNSTTAPADSDVDGIPDGWLTTNYPGKTANELTAEGYTYLELYMNSLVNTITINQNADAVISGLNIPNKTTNFNTKCIYSNKNQKITVTSDSQINRIFVNDLSGRIIKTLLVNENNATFDVSTLNSSVYMVKVIRKNAFAETFKVIK